MIVTFTFKELRLLSDLGPFSMFEIKMTVVEAILTPLRLS